MIVAPSPDPAAEIRPCRASAERPSRTGEGFVASRVVGGCLRINDESNWLWGNLSNRSDVPSDLIASPRVDEHDRIVAGLDGDVRARASESAGTDEQRDRALDGKDVDVGEVDVGRLRCVELRRRADERAAECDGDRGNHAARGHELLRLHGCFNLS